MRETKEFLSIDELKEKCDTMDVFMEILKVRRMNRRVRVGNWDNVLILLYVIFSLHTYIHIFKLKLFVSINRNVKLKLMPLMSMKIYYSWK